MIEDRYGAFCTHDPVSLAGAASGPLAGLRFAAKDGFDVEGRRSCGGNPDWLRTHEPAGSTAPALQALLDAGAGLAGKTQMDELAYSINGENHFYGTPVNPRNPDRIPGGSSSGSAVAVAAGLVDFAIGSDTAGSVRLPASFCGIPGFRPTHGAVSIRGCMPLAPSYDTVGWFARDPTMLVRVGRVLLPPQASAVPGRLLVATDAFDLAGEPIGAALAPQVDRLRARFGHVEEIALAPESLFAWQQTMRVVQGYEVWRAHREWIGRAKPAFFRARDPGALRMGVDDRRRRRAGRIGAARAALPPARCAPRGRGAVHADRALRGVPEESADRGAESHPRALLALRGQPGAAAAGHLAGRRGPRVPGRAVAPGPA